MVSRGWGSRRNLRAGLCNSPSSVVFFAFILVDSHSNVDFAVADLLFFHKIFVQTMQQMRDD